MTINKFYSKAAVVILSCTVYLVCSGPEVSGTIRHVHPHVIIPAPRPAGHLSGNASFNRWRSREVMTALKNSGLELVELQAGLIVSAPAAQDSIIFLLPSYGSDIGAMVATYSSGHDLDDALKIHSSMNKVPESPVWRIFRKDNVLLLISGVVPEEKARQYEKVLQDMLTTR